MTLDPLQTRPQQVSSTPGAEAAENSPTIVSFYGGRQYYYDAAEKLREDCVRLGLPHCIEERDTNGMDWADICRLKIQFYHDMQEAHGAILWIDVDDRILQRPTLLANCKFDIAGFGGRFQYIRDYDPYQVTRFWVPSILFFGGTPASRRFVNLMLEIEASTTEPVTDDWVLHEAWLRHDEQLNVGLLAPHLVARKVEQITPQSVILHGDSGSVGDFRNKVVQHERRLDNPELRSRVLLAESRDLMKSNQRATATLLAERAYRATPSLAEAALQYGNYLAFTGKRLEGIALLNEFIEAEGDVATVREQIVHHARMAGARDTVGEHLGALLSSPDWKTKARAESVAYDVWFDDLASSRGIPDSKRLRMWWMKTPYPGNFGDILSPWIVERVTGIPPRFGRRDSGLLAVGSIIKFARGKSVVWGSGTPRMDDALSPDARYLAVRGPLTRQLVRSSGGQCPDVYGDPGLLLPLFIPKSRKTTHPLGLIRHVNHENASLQIEDGVKDISLLGVGDSFIREVVDEITSCEAILTTSLHGLIVANAYGIPARLCRFSDHEAVTGDGTKYADYFQSVGLREQTPLDLSHARILDPSLRREIPQEVDLDFDADKLMDALISDLA